jgi:hypothetical protein
MFMAVKTNVCCLEDRCVCNEQLQLKNEESSSFIAEGGFTTMAIRNVVHILSTWGPPAPL